MKDWQVAIVAICMMIVLFVAIDSFVKGVSAPEPCEKSECLAMMDRHWCVQRTEACRHARKMVEMTCFPNKGASK